MSEQSLTLEPTEKTTAQGEIVHDNNSTEKSKKAPNLKVPVRIK